MSSSSATCRCCCSCCSGTTPCSGPCRSRAIRSRWARASSSIPAACSCPARSMRPTSGSIGAALLHRHRRRPIVFRRWAKTRAGADRAAISRRPRHPRARSSALPVARLDRPGAGRGEPDQLRHAAEGDVQSSRRHADPARIRRAARRPRDLHGGLHRRGRARRHPRGLEGADGSGRIARAEARADAPPRRHSAGHAGDHPAADEPVSQPDEELVARGRHRLSRSRPGVHGHRAEPDGPGHRGRRHHHGRLSHDQPRRPRSS